MDSLSVPVNKPGRSPVTALAEGWARAAGAREAARTEEARKAVRDAETATLDALRALRRDRRAFEKAREEVAWWNVFNGERRAARAVVRDSQEAVREARAVRREARKAYPMTLPQLAVRCHAAYLVPVAVWDTVADSIASGVALWTGVAAAVANSAVAIVAAHRNGATAAAPDPVAEAFEAMNPSQEERDLMAALEPAAWADAAAPRGLEDVTVTGATLTASGIQAHFVLNGTMDVPTLRRREAQVRAALRLREGTRLELREGKSGGRARLTLRTRSASEGVRLEGWEPGAVWGIDTVTGETVAVPLGRRMLVAGTSGSGKSWSARPILAEASEADDHRLVILDMKRIEARLWKHRARTAVQPRDIADVLSELVAEMYARFDLIPDGEDVVQISPSLPRVTVFVDEGSELISESKKKPVKVDGEVVFDPGAILEDLRTLARMGRAAEIIVVWATQKPMLSGDSPGLDTQVAAQVTCRLSLAVSSQKEAMVVFGDDAITDGWLAHKLPLPGVAMLRDSNTAQPHHIRMRAMSPRDVIALPERPVWSRRASSTGATSADIDARKALEQAGDPWARVTTSGPDADTIPGLARPRVSGEDRDDQICAELAKDPCRSLSSLAKSIGASKSVVKRRLDRMEADGIVTRDEEGCWHLVP